MTDDPERLVAEALRAHAARTPLPAPTDQPTSQPTSEPTRDAEPVLGGYGLISGSGVPVPPARPEPTLREPAGSEETHRTEPDRGIAVGWILLLALLLGLAAGAIVGLVTLL